MKPIWQLIDSSAVGGIERHIEILARGLRRVGLDCEVVLFADYGANPWFDQLRDANIPYRTLRGSIGDLQRTMKSVRPSMVHTHGYKAGILGRPVARLLKIPVISTFHSGERAAFPVSVYQAIDEYSAFLAPSIAVSEPIKERLPKSARLIHNFVDMPTQTTDPTRERKRIGFVGRFSHEKAPDYFCALADMLRHAPALEKAEWHMYGDGDMMKDLQKKFDGEIFFHGLQTDMDAVWPLMDLLIMPSRAEGLPLAALEAMSHGVPVIAPKLGALPDVIVHGKTGWLFDVNNLDQAADHIMTWAALGPDGWQKMFDANRQQIAANFSAQSRLKTMIDIYQNAGMKLVA